MSDGAELIAAERRRQVEQEGWTPEHDARHEDDDLALAAAAYALPRHWREHTDDQGNVQYGDAKPPKWWPWAAVWWKPKPGDRVRELVKAGALIAAEIDRVRAREEAN